MANQSDFGIVDIKALLTECILSNIQGAARADVVIQSIGFDNVVSTLENFKYDDYSLNDVEPRLINEWEINNNGGESVSHTFTEAASTTLKESWSVTNGITIKENFGFKIDSVFDFGTDITITFSETHSQDVTRTITDTNCTTIPIPPYSKDIIKAILFEYKVSVPWTAKIQLKGQFNLKLQINRPVHNIEFEHDYPIGLVFKKINHPLIEVIDDDTILFSASGNYRGVSNQKWAWDIQTVPATKEKGISILNVIAK
jgi:hypothetical protein